MSVGVRRVSVGAGRARSFWDVCVTPCRDLPGHLLGFGHQEPAGQEEDQGLILTSTGLSLQGRGRCNGQK